jgi:hypothetical protein
MTKNLKWIKTFEEVQSIGVSSLYDTGASGAFNRWANANPALEFEEEITNKDKATIIYKHIDKTNPHPSGSPRDAFMGIPSDLSIYDWNIEPIDIFPDDPKINKEKLYPASKRDVKRYMSHYKKYNKEGIDFPAIVLVDNGTEYTILDGAHRLQSAINLNVPIKAYIGYIK